MADTRIQLQVEDWVRAYWMPRTLGQGFRRERVPLKSGGVFDFDAVSDDGKVVAAISTSGAYTSAGKLAVGKLHKLRSDMLFLLLAEAERRLIILTERDMFDLCCREKEAGRVPAEIEFLHADIPGDLRARLNAARKTASDEVQPRSRRP